GLYKVDVAGDGLDGKVLIARPGSGAETIGPSYIDGGAGCASGIDYLGYLFDGRLEGVISVVDLITGGQHQHMVLIIAQIFVPDEGQLLQDHHGGDHEKYRDNELHHD